MALRLANSTALSAKRTQLHNVFHVCKPRARQSGKLGTGKSAFLLPPRLILKAIAQQGMQQIVA
jgi:hypothetical protein